MPTLNAQQIMTAYHENMKAIERKNANLMPQLWYESYNINGDEVYTNKAAKEHRKSFQEV